jgi:putative membrane protein
MNGFSNGMSGAGWVMMSLLVLLFCALVIGGIVWAIRGAGRRDRLTMPSERSAARILDARFARGDMNEAEYRRRRDLITPQ